MNPLRPFSPCSVIVWPPCNNNGAPLDNYDLNATVQNIRLGIDDGVFARRPGQRNLTELQQMTNEPGYIGTFWYMHEDEDDERSSGVISVGEFFNWYGVEYQ